MPLGVRPALSRRQIAIGLSPPCRARSQTVQRLDELKEPAESLPADLERLTVMVGRFDLIRDGVEVGVRQARPVFVL